jgi:hypothetical protein
VNFHWGWQTLFDAHDQTAPVVGYSFDFTCSGISEPRRSPMRDTRKGFAALVAFAVVAVTSPAASAISADLAKKCRELAIRAHPTQPAGTKSGTEQAQRDYFRECVAKNGDMSK